MRRYSFSLRPEVAFTLKVIGLLIAAIVIVALAVSWVGYRHAARTADQRVCLAELRELRARNPFVERYVMPSDACVALAVVRGER